MQPYVKLIAHTPEPEKVVSAAAKLCYSKVGATEIMDNLTQDNISKFLDMLVSMGHESPLEHVSFTFAIENVSRALTHQLVRHRLASYCLSGDTVVYTDKSNREVKKRTIKELYEMKQQYLDMTYLRCIDESTKNIINNKIKSVVYSGKKEVYKVTTKLGYTIKATLEHKFFTEKGWQRLKNINIGDKVYVNGVEYYKDKNWLRQKYNEENLSQEQIAELCGVSKHTIRAWIRKFGLQKQYGSWSIGVEPPNKGKTKYTYAPLMSTSIKMKGNTNHKKKYGAENPMYKGVNVTISGAYAAAIKKFKKSNKCMLCGFVGETELHHIDKNPRNNNEDNVLELCVKCHKLYHKKDVIKHVILDEVISIEFVGIEDTYDIEMHEPHHNFVANGFVVHNSQQSQRYVSETQFDYITPTLIETNSNTRAIYNETMAYIQNMYNVISATLMQELLLRHAYENNAAELIAKLQSANFKNVAELREYLKDTPYNKLAMKYEKMAIEEARYVLPNATETKIVTTMNARELLHFFEKRCCNRAQEEIRILATEMLRQAKEVAPTLFKYAGPPCFRNGKCPEGAMTCGQMNEVVNMFKNI